MVVVVIRLRWCGGGFGILMVCARELYMEVAGVV